MSFVLGIETSCDECSASVVSYKPGENVEVLSLSTFSQIKIHEPNGGVVPEIASRNHLETMNEMIQTALSESGVESKNLDAIAVTNRPGLVGALLVGVSAAKSIAYALEKPLIAVHHLEGHAASIFLSPRGSDLTRKTFPLPLLLAIVSGGHTNLYRMDKNPEEWPENFLSHSLIAQSRDDAAGEAFDKIAKTLGFPYPGGKWIDQYSEKGNPHAFSLPKALAQKSILDFSFSGLKTAVFLLTEKLKKQGIFEASVNDLCASAQEAIVDSLVSKIGLAIAKEECRSLALVGGVSANRRLRTRLNDPFKNGAQLELSPLFPAIEYSTDNAAMIAAAGAFRLHQGQVLSLNEVLTLNAIANPLH